ncbi:hypothetical protein [Metabacillus bambusae]|uniref:Yip1 domain-containing protein n=1 Tax=Metabacillus bambusae TaxID=2795218 RepID=A0ABS3N0X2_9BACI|nr:hypothetical protein [Metabacillus bambusae]MBO1511805.1 hypothetical protein [Metabacillus bambusae]
MTYEMKILKGLFQPGTSLYQLQRAETMTGVIPKLLLLYLVALISIAVSTYFGIGAETYSGTITEQNKAEFEAGKLLVFGGKLASSVLYTTLFIWLAALFFWIMLDISYLKAVIVQMFVFTIHLFEQAITVPILVLFDLNQVSNPFSFGVISQYLFKNEFWQHFFGSITLFHFLAISVLFYYLKNLSDRNKFGTLTVIVLFYLIIWMLTALMAYVEVPVIVRRVL